MTCTMRAQFVEELLRALQGLERADDLLDVGELEAVLVEDLEPAAHELVVIRLVARGAAQLCNAGLLGDGDPNLGSEHSLHVEGYD